VSAPRRDSRLDAARRSADLEALAGGEVVDVLVVGGGITGVGVALDAASRGLSVALVERRDLAHGTSRWSSKLVHGGLRYLAALQFGIAHESAVERGILLRRTAPHLVRPFPMLVPYSSDVSTLEATAFRLGVEVADLLKLGARTSWHTLPRPRRLPAPEALRLVPSLRPKGLRGGLLYWDGQLEDDARLVVAVARTAAAHGARVLTYCSALSLHGDGARVRDERGGSELDLRARHVVNATGVWAGTLEPGVALRPSRGTHVVLQAASLGLPRAGVTVPVPGEPNRYVFAVPHPDGLVHVGLTDDAVEGPLPDVPSPGPGDEEFLVRTLSAALQRPIGPDEVVGRFAGLRPLLAGGDESTADLSRRHAVVEGADGVLTVVGGKLTTYRRMAQDTVDRIAARPGVGVGRCRTASLPLVGAASPSDLSRVPAPARLVRRYGAEAPVVASLAAGDPALLAPVAEGLPVLGVELLFGATHEGALTVEDLLDRRTRLGLVAADRALAVPAAEALLDRAASATHLPG
jgi:glycerol-3-phosphate dehydrogenase